MADWLETYYSELRREEIWRQNSEAYADKINEYMERTGLRNPQVAEAILALRKADREMKDGESDG